MINDLTVMILALLMFWCMAICLIRGVDININVNHNYDYPDLLEIKDQFDSDGNPIDEETKATIDDFVKSVNDIMLGQEDDSNDA